MKTSQFKQIIIEAVREAIRIELKDILLETIKISKSDNGNTVNKLEENKNSSPINNSKPTPSLDIKTSYLEILDEMKQGPKNPLEGELQIHSLDTISEGSSLPTGQVDLSQISKLLRT